MEKALDDITVLDLGQVIAMPYCTMLLADLGARVIKVESREQGQERLSLGIRRVRNGEEERVPVYQYRERNKHAITLNLKHPKGVELFNELVKHADVVAENFSVGTMDRLGIGYEALKAVNPRIILASISGFGQDGPYRDRPGFDQIAQGMGGLMSITGLPGQGPVRVGIPIADLCAGLFCAYGILAALLEREVSGEGQWVQTSLLQAQIFMLDFQATRC